MSLLGFGQPLTGVFQMCYLVEDIEASMQHWVEQLGVGGHALAFETWVPTGGRVGYVDTTAELPGYLELIEMDAATDAAFTRFYAQSLAWDGTDPVRPFA